MVHSQGSGGPNEVGVAWGTATGQHEEIHIQPQMALDNVQELATVLSRSLPIVSYCKNHCLSRRSALSQACPG